MNSPSWSLRQSQSGRGTTRTKSTWATKISVALSTWQGHSKEDPRGTLRLIDPEQMYKHIGKSDCRPHIKPMHEDVKQTLSKFQNKHKPSSQDSYSKVPIAHLHSDSLTYLLGTSPPVSSNTRPSSSFNVVYPQNPDNPNERLPACIYGQMCISTKHVYLRRFWIAWLTCCVACIFCLWHAGFHLQVQQVT